MNHLRASHHHTSFIFFFSCLGFHFLRLIVLRGRRLDPPAAINPHLQAQMWVGRLPW